MYPLRGDGPAVAPLFHTAVPYQLRPDVYTSAFAKSFLFACTTVVSTLQNILCIFFVLFKTYLEVNVRKETGGSEGAVARYVIAWWPARYRRLTEDLWYGICSRFCVALHQKLVFLLPRDTFASPVPAS